MMMLLLAVNMVSIFGFATFVLHPELLVRWPATVPIFTVTFQFFSQAQILISFLVLIKSITAKSGRRWIPSALLLYAISFCCEFLGTKYGIPFGKYSYSDLLGVKILNHVPVVIPLSWFTMAIPSYAIALSALPRPTQTLSRILVAALLLLTWDLSLDPAMSYLTSYWSWHQSGAYYGMPAINLFGWFVTGLLLMTALHFIKADQWISTVSDSWYRKYYIINASLPLGLVAAAGLWPALLVSVCSYGCFALFLKLRGVPLQWEAAS